MLIACIVHNDWGFAAFYGSVAIVLSVYLVLACKVRQWPFDPNRKPAKRD